MDINIDFILHVIYNLTHCWFLPCNLFNNIENLLRQNVDYLSSDFITALDYQVNNWSDSEKL